MRSSTLLVLTALVAPAMATGTSVASKCLEIGEKDGLLILDVQNAFMEERSTRSGVSAVYDLSVDAPNGTIPRGTLSVSNSSGIIEVINAWLALRERDNKNASVIATLDYHPPGHCSFCDVAHGGIEPLTSEGLLQFCLQGRQTWSFDNTAGAVHLNDSHRCRDSVSQAAWDASMYYQWPYHAVAGTFDARFDPYLKLPNDTVVFKLGTRLMEDNYNAFDGGRRSTAAAGTHDEQVSASDALDDASHTLEAELTARGVKRLFVFGLATDYVVGQTVYNALGLSPFTSPVSQLVGGAVVVVDAGVRAISSSTSVYENIRTRDVSTYPSLYNTYPDGYVVTATAPADALSEYCSRGMGTCDSVDQCEASYTSNTRREYFCRPLQDLPWGECAACPVANASTSICSGHGDCYTYCTAKDPSTDLSGYCDSLPEASPGTHAYSGVCRCDFLYSGDACEFDYSIPFITMLVVGGMLCCSGTLIVAFVLYRRHNKPGLRVESTGLPPVLSLEDGHEYHLFLSHIWATGQDQVAVIKRSLTSLLPGVKIFLDVDDLKDIDQLEKHIESSAVILVFLSAGYFKSRNCLREIRAAVDKQKPLILVHESDSTKGGAPLKELKEMCPADLRHAVFTQPEIASLSKSNVKEPNKANASLARLIIPWHRLVAFQLESLRQIAEETLLHSPKYKGLLAKGKKVDLFLPQRVGHSSMITDFKYFMESPHRLITSSNNRGAEEAAKELAESMSNVAHTHFVASEGSFAELLHNFMAVKCTRRSKSSKFMTRVRNEAVRGTMKSGLKVQRAPTAPLRRHSSLFPEGSVARSPHANASEPTGNRHGRSNGVASAPRVQATGNCHMLLYLNEKTFAEDSCGDALADDIRDALAAGVQMLVVHEREPDRGALPFDHFYHVTPEDLVRRGLYRELATPWYPGRHARVSRAVAASAMGASRTVRRAVREREREAKRNRRIASIKPITYEVEAPPANVPHLEPVLETISEAPTSNRGSATSVSVPAA